MPHEYIASFITPGIKGAGTDAHVYITLISQTRKVRFIVGDRGRLDEDACKTSIGDIDEIGDIGKVIMGGCVLRDRTLESGTVSSFSLQVDEFIGEIIEIAIELKDEHTNDNPAWYLARVEISTTAGGIPVVWKFPVERWIGTGKDPYHKEEQVNKIRINQQGPL